MKTLNKLFSLDSQWDDFHLVKTLATINKLVFLQIIIGVWSKNTVDITHSKAFYTLKMKLEKELYK